MTRRPTLHLNQDEDLDWLAALEFGRIDEGQPDGCWEPVGEHVGILKDGPYGAPAGFAVHELSTFDPDDAQYASLWIGPRFDCPTLGLVDVPPNAIVVAARALFGTGDTINRVLFSRAIAADGEPALRAWLRVLQTGDQMAHYALGYTLLELGRDAEAYRHLRFYTELAPTEAWAWIYYARAAAACGEMTEARTAIDRAVELDDEQETPALELLEELRTTGTLERPDTDADDETDAFVGMMEGIAPQWALEEGRRSAILDLPERPVYVGYQGDALWMSVEVGPAGGRDDLDEVLDDVSAWLVVHEDELTLVHHFDDPVDRDLLQVLVRGMAARAAELHGVLRDRGIALGAPASFAELTDP